jgi:hypothetical protein
MQTQKPGPLRPAILKTWSNATPSASHTSERSE